MARNCKKIDGIKVVYNDKIITIKESRKIAYEDIPQFCVKLKEELPFDYTRSLKSWEKEIVAHNFLYDLDLFTIHTEDTDLDEREKLHRIISYEFLYFAHNVYSFFARRR